MPTMTWPVLGAVSLALVATGYMAGTNGEGPTAEPTPEPIPTTVELTDAEQAAVHEHLVGGLPGAAKLLIRKAYVAGYDTRRRVPWWVAYKITPDFRKTPDRSGRFDAFRTDPDVEGAVRDAEYSGLFNGRGFARGHLAPYGIAGGDRDGDGQYAHITQSQSDPDDETTIFQVNYLSNIAPQHHNGFNGSPGMWYELERWVQDDLVRDGGRTIHEIAGCIFGFGEHEKVGPQKDVWVPPAFFKLVIADAGAGQPPKVLAFLMPHHRKAHGSIEDFLVSVDVIEALSGLDFFHELDDAIEKPLEDEDSSVRWDGF